MTLRRALAIWLGSFLVIAALLVVYCRVPLMPVLAAGVLTLAITMVRSSRARQRFRSCDESKQA